MLFEAEINIYSSPDLIEIIFVMIEYKKITRKEKKVLDNLGREFGVNINKAFKNKSILVGHGKRKEVFITNRSTSNTLDIIEKEPYFTGLYIGDIKGNRFLLGLEGASIISSYSDKKIIVDKKTEQLVLYGRDIFSKSAHGLPKNVQVNEKILIMNEYDECIGVGIVEKGDILIKNISDRGWYLRKGE